MNVKIQGTIVSPDYDDEYFAAWIDRGIITPSSRVVAAIESATEPIDLYINTYGGDVFAGGEMYIAIIKAAMASKIRKCEVGSIAASMGANIVASLAARGVPCSGFSNSQLMFHGCYTETVGGAQHHEDVARSLRNINEKVIADLNHIGIENCRAWFAEGREMWLSADGLVEMKIFKGIADGFGEELPEIKHTAVRLAAFASNFTSRKEYMMKLDDTIKAEEPKPETAEQTAAPEVAPKAAPAVEEQKPEASEAEQTAEVAAPVAPTEAEIEEKVQQLANERFASLQSKHDQMISELKTKLANAEAALATANAERDQAVEDSAKARAALDEAVNQAKLAEQNRESVVTAALAPAPKSRAERKAEVERNWQALMHERTVARRK